MHSVVYPLQLLCCMYVFKGVNYGWVGCACQKHREHINTQHVVLEVTSAQVRARYPEFRRITSRHQILESYCTFPATVVHERRLLPPR